MDDIWSSSKNITDDETCLRPGFLIRSYDMNEDNDENDREKHDEIKEAKEPNESTIFLGE